MKVVLATSNQGKLKELKKLAAQESWLTIESAPADFNPEETGSTFVENARIKAMAAAKLTGLTAVADDSGLVVEALNGKPGVHSSRYCPGTDADRRAKLLQELSAVPADRRQAAFVCAMIVCQPDGNVTFSAIRYWEGRIGTQERGANGFGYDPLFYLVNQDKTAAELSAEDKNKLSHRGQAWRQVIGYLKQQNSLLNKA